MQFFRDSNIQFMKYRKYWVFVSLAFLALSIFSVFLRGQLNLGIDFAGGTQLTVKLREEPEIQRLRGIVEAIGLGDVQIQSFGDPGSGEILIKAQTVAGSEEGSRGQIVGALNEALNEGGSANDLNQMGSDALAALLLQQDPDGLAAADPQTAQQLYHETATEFLAVRKAQGIIREWADFEGKSEISAAALSVVRDNVSLGQFTIVGAENVGPQIGAELRRKGIWAVALSLLGMLIYIWFRFELRFGIGALVAVLHDIFITLGLYALAGLEFNLTTVAGFLTLVGYSVNDSVVVFDRVRENMRRRRSASLEETMNLSLNQTLSRTVLTSGTTLLAVGTLLLFGGDVLRGFAFILTIGVIVGTYSSIYVASPFALLWEQFFGRQARTLRKESKTARS